MRFSLEKLVSWELIFWWYFVELKWSSCCHQRVDRMTAWAHWACSTTLSYVESAQHSQRAVRSSPHTGRELSGGEVAHRMLTWSHNGDLHAEKWMNICYSHFLVCFIVVWSNFPGQPRCLVSGRSTWLNSGASSCDEDQLILYLIQYIAVLTHLLVRGSLLRDEILLFEKKLFFRKKLYWEKSWKK